MITKFYPLFSFLIAVVIAQASKPFLAYPRLKKINWLLIFSSGGYPSSHSAGVAALCFAVGMIEEFNSTLFAITLAIGLIVLYDAANVRLYSGKNIQLTKQIVEDLNEEGLLDMDEPIYHEKIKQVLGHKWLEVIAGVILGILVAFVLYCFRA